MVKKKNGIIFIFLVQSACRTRKAYYICTRNQVMKAILTGEMAEWSNAAVLKTVDCNRSGGSNPSFSATWSLKENFKKIKPLNTSVFEGFFLK